jgi:hypothetical protein
MHHQSLTVVGPHPTYSGQSRSSPGRPDVADQREVPPELDRAGQLAAVIVSAADCFGGASSTLDMRARLGRSRLKREGRGWDALNRRPAG